MGSGHVGFRSCGLQALELRLSSHGAWAQMLHDVWNLPGPGIKPMSLALPGDSYPLYHQGSPRPSISLLIFQMLVDFLLFPFLNQILSYWPISFYFIHIAPCAAHAQKVDD